MYSGYTYDQLCRMARREPSIAEVLDRIDMLIDGPYIARLSANAGTWTGSGNQRVINLPAMRSLVDASSAARTSRSGQEQQRDG